MTFDRYQELLKSNGCYVIDNNNQLVLLSSNGKLLIEINCIPVEAIGDELNKNIEHQIIVFVYPASNNHPELQVNQVTANKVMIMSDCENIDQATSYELTIDENNEEVFLRIYDFPNVGKMYISQKEISGIHKKLWKPHGFIKE